MLPENRGPQKDEVKSKVARGGSKALADDTANQVVGSGVGKAKLAISSAECRCSALCGQGIHDREFFCLLLHFASAT